MYIGEISKRTGASPKAIRLYESLGLLVNVKREGSYRTYSERDIEFVKLIKEAQTLGVSLADLKQLVVAENELDWLRVTELLADKQNKVDAQIAFLQAQKKRITVYQRSIQDCLDSY